MRLWIKAVLLTLWNMIRWLAFAAVGFWIGSVLAEILPEAASAVIAVAFLAAILLLFGAMVTFLIYVSVRDKHDELEEKQKEAV